jgi:hypothetical protein
MTSDPVDSVFAHRERIRKPGWQKALPWIVGILLVGGLIGGLIAAFGTNTGHSTATPLDPNHPAKDVSKIPKTVKLEPAAEKTARRFIETAVARKNLREAYGISGPQIIQGQSLKSFMSGNNAVIPYPVKDVAYAPMKVDYSYKNEALIEVALLPKPKAKVKAQMFMMQLNKVRGKWLVNSWVPKNQIFVHSQQ